MKAASAATPLSQRRVMPRAGSLLLTVASLACLAALAVVLTDNRSGFSTQRSMLFQVEPELVGTSYMNEYQGQVLSAAPAPCTSLAGCEVTQPNYEDPASAPTYNGGEGMTYMPSTTSGVSSEDQSPDIPAYFLDEEAKSEKRMKRLMSVLKKSRKMQDILDAKVKKLKDFVDEEKTTIKNDVVQMNMKDSDKIASPSHDVVGARGPPGPPGLNGLAAANGINGAPGPEGPRGRQGDTGPTGSLGVVGPPGSQGQRGVTGVQGITGGVGPGGLAGPEGPEDGSATWGASKYFCPGGATKTMRLMDCNTGSCRLETKYNGVWGSVCDTGFTQKSADAICNALGFPEGGKARRHGGGGGPIWLSGVKCLGHEGDIGDCPKQCGAPGCGHGNDVGLCCNGFVVEKKGHRTNTRAIMKTVRELRKQCYKPDSCPAVTKGEKTVSFNQNCGSPPKGGWKSAMGIGTYARFSKGVCDDDSNMCVHKCGMENNQLGSMDIPDGLAVKLYDGSAFRGTSITYYGPRKVDCLNWEGWQNRASSIKIMKAKSRPRSAWTMRVFHGGGRALNSMPATTALDYVGSGTTNYINFHSSGEINTQVKGTPNHNYMVAFYGNVRVRTGGKYTFCTTSSDGSYLFVGSLSNKVVDNGGRHGVKQVCKEMELKTGNTYHVIVHFFKGGSGGATVQAMWSGPDTQGNSMLLGSDDAVSAVPPPPRKSNWALRMFAASWNLKVIPMIENTKYVGSKTGISVVDFSNYNQFKNLVSATPSTNYVWVFYGSLRIGYEGKYYLCTSSDDGSKIEVGGKLVVMNDGLHGNRKYCGAITLKPGDHDVEVIGFQAGGGVVERVTYSGPDTGGAEIMMGSKGAKAGDMPKLPLPTPSIWKLRVYSTSYRPLLLMPDVTHMTFTSEADVEYVSFKNQGELNNLIPKAPHDYYAWVAYGALRIKNAGVYNLCSTSDDGSYIYVDKDMVVENDGLHGPRKKCADVKLSAGTHQIAVCGFENQGGVYQTVEYRGPDTSNVFKPMRSIGKGGGGWAPKDVAQTPYKIGVWPPRPPQWRLRIYTTTTVPILLMPDVTKMTFVNQADVDYVSFRNQGEINRLVSKVPNDYYAWVGYGALEVNTAGTYNLCTTSDDGSYLYVDKKMIVENDGLHGPRKKCADVHLDKGVRQVLICGFENQGGAYQTVDYRGPDTGNAYRAMQSLAPGGGGSWAPSNVMKTPYKIGVWPPRPPQWLLRIYTTTTVPIQIMPDVTKMTFVNQAEVDYVSFRNQGEINKLVSKVPNDYYAWVGYGALEVNTAGTYNLCSTSDDGSYLYVDKKMIVENDGLHGPRKKCADVHLDKGVRQVLICGFENQGGAYQTVDYRGPDTGNAYRAMQSIAKGGGASWAPSNVMKTPYQIGVWPPRPPQWLLRIYTTTYRPLEIMPDPTMMTFVDQNEVDYVTFRHQGELNNLVKKAPHDYYAWVAYGMLEVKNAGTYNLCTRSDDGSYIYVDKNMVVSNDGLHGPVTKCEDYKLSAGLHEVIVCGFENQGGVYEQVTYRGPDTGNRHIDMRSVGKGGGKGWAPNNVQKMPYKVGKWPPKPPPSYKAGGWPNGYCWPQSNTCASLGIKENQCGRCTALPNGGVRLENSHGLRFNGASYDDNQIGKGSYQAMNICMLAKYGNGGTITKKATSDCAGYSIYSSSNSQVHWYGNCRKGDSREASCCSNAELLKSGFDWNKFSKGNSCGGDSDKDYSLGKVDCYFEK